MPGIYAHAGGPGQKKAPRAHGRADGRAGSTGGCTGGRAGDFFSKIKLNHSSVAIQADPSPFGLRDDCGVAPAYDVEVVLEPYDIVPGVGDQGGEERGASQRGERELLDLGPP